MTIQLQPTTMYRAHRDLPQLGVTVGDFLAVYPESLQVVRMVPQIVGVIPQRQLAAAELAGLQPLALSAD